MWSTYLVSLRIHIPLYVDICKNIKVHSTLLQNQTWELITQHCPLTLLTTIIHKAHNFCWSQSAKTIHLTTTVWNPTKIKSISLNNSFSASLLYNHNINTHTYISYHRHSSKYPHSHSKLNYSIEIKWRITLKFECNFIIQLI